MCLAMAICSFTCPAYATTSTQQETPSGTGKPHVDFSQADLMLAHLKGVAENNISPAKVDAVLEAKGTELIIKQMNLARRVTPSQYEQVLRALAKGTFPRLEPLDSSDRAKRGLLGLEKNVWRALRWAIDHTGVLEERMTAFRHLDLYEEARDLALKYLPKPVEISPSLFVVMGGRAGFAALDGDKIYFDILVRTYLSVSRDEPPVTDTELTEFFAHEMHHLGLARIMRQTGSSAHMGGNQSRLFGFLLSLVQEGSASYLINSHRDLERMRSDPGFSDYLGRTDDLLNTTETVIRSALNGSFNDAEGFDKLTSPMLGHGYHSTGAFMLSVIDRAQGLDSIMEILADPRLLLTRYNEAARTLRRDPVPVYTFDSGLAEQVSGLGRTPGR